MDRSCREHGFFRIPVDCVDRRVADAAWADAQTFFDQDEATKDRVGFPEPGYPYGYSSFGLERLARSLGEDTADPDLKESFSAGPDCGTASIGGPNPGAETEWIRSPTPWPEHPATMAHTWSAYYRALGEVTEQLMSIMAVALSLPAKYFTPLVDKPISSMRALRYPPLPAGSSGLRAGAHSDYGTLTILRTDDIPGLEIRELDGRWTPVEAVPNTLLVNLGDSIAQWTNDRWRSTVHRVSAVDPRQRSSFAFFHMANWDTEIRCLPTCHDEDNPPRHEPALAGPWLMRKFQSTVS